MRAANARFCRQPRKLVERVGHLLGGALEQLAAACGEHRVAAEQRFQLRAVVADLATSVARQPEHPNRQPQNLERVAFGKRNVAGRNRLAARAVDAGRGGARGFGHPTDMVLVMMGD